MLSSLEDNQKSLLKQSLSESEQKFQFGGNVARPCQMSILTFSTNSICQPGLRNYRKNPCSPRLTDLEFLYFDIDVLGSQHNISKKVMFSPYAFLILQWQRHPGLKSQWIWIYKSLLYLGNSY